MSQLTRRVRPLGALVGLALLAPAALAAQDALPPAATLVAKHVEAIGGEAAIRKHTAARIVGSMEIPAAGLKGTMTIFSAAPARTAAIINVPGVGEIRSGYDGTAGWEVNPMAGARLLEGPELARMAEEADFHGGMLRTMPAIAGRETVERTELGGQPCYKVKVSWKSGRESFECYAVEGGLLVALQSVQESPMGRMDVTQLMGDYKEFGGVKYATTLRQQMMGAEQILRIESVEFGPVDEAAFAPPPAIRTLLDAKGAGTP